MPDAVKRLNYYDHQFLRAPDFIDEQHYHLNMRRLHNSSLHTWGIVQGFQVTLAGGGTGTAVTVNAGVALDSAGREIVLPADTNLELGGEAAGTTLYITIAYDEQQSDPTTEAGGPGNTRVTELPKLSFSKDQPADKSTTLILAKVPRTTTGLGTVDESDRKQAGVVLGNDLALNTLTLKKDGVTQANWPVLTCGAANQAALTNAGLVVNGSMGIGTAAPAATLDVNNTSTKAGAYTAILGRAIADNNFTLAAKKPQATNQVGDAVLALGLSYGTTTENANIRFHRGGDVNGGFLSFSTANDAERLRIDGSGKLVSPMWKVTQLFNQHQGPLPLGFVGFSSGGGTLVILFSGSGWTLTSGGATIGMSVEINETVVGSAFVDTNEANSHKAFTTGIIVLPSFPAGAHSLKLVLAPNTITDVNDYFGVTVLELPF